jgi:hypothetical protein
MNGQATLERLQADKRRLQEQGPTAATPDDLRRWSEIIRADVKRTEQAPGDVVIVSGLDSWIVALAWELLDLAGMGETMPDDETGEQIARVPVTFGGCADASR